MQMTIALPFYFFTFLLFFSTFDPKLRVINSSQ